MNATLLAAIGVGTNTRPSTHTLTDAPGHTSADQPPQPPGLPIYLILEPVDMRLGIGGLSACVQHRLQQPPCAGGLYLSFDRELAMRISSVRSTSLMSPSANAAMSASVMMAFFLIRSCCAPED